MPKKRRKSSTTTTAVPPKRSIRRTPIGGYSPKHVADTILHNQNVKESKANEKKLELRKLRRQGRKK